MIDTTKPIDLDQLSIDERIELVEAIWESIAEQSPVIAPTAAQKCELDRRLEAYRRDPERGSTWDDVRRRLEDA
ncbi:MAG: addiction module protein [Planctomycetaceae bacterium]